MTIEHWDWMSSRYESKYSLDSTSSKITIARKASDMSYGMKGKILEIGCGTGLFTKEFSRYPNIELTCIDSSARMLSIAKSRFPLVKFLCQDATNTNFADRSFDGAFGGYVLQWISLDLLFKELSRLVKPGGRIAFVTDNIYNPLVILLRLLNYLDSRFRDRVYPKFIPYKLVRHLLTKYGFTSIELIPFSFTSNSRVNSFLERYFSVLGGSLLVRAIRS